MKSTKDDNQHSTSETKCDAPSYKDTKKPRQRLSGLGPLEWFISWGVWKQTAQGKEELQAGSSRSQQEIPGMSHGTDPEKAGQGVSGTLRLAIPRCIGRDSIQASEEEAMPEVSKNRDYPVMRLKQNMI